MNQSSFNISAPANKGNVTVESVSFNWNKDVIEAWPATILKGIFDMAYRIRNEAHKNSPIVTGALRNSIRIPPVQIIESHKEVWVVAGGTSSPGIYNGRQIIRYVDYAAKVEEKSSRPHYMKRAQETVMSGDWMHTYFKDFAK